MSETVSRVGNLLKNPRSMLAIGSIGLLSVTGCGTAGTGREPNVIKFCSAKEAQGPVASPGSKDENDPQTILDFAEGKHYGDLSAGSLNGTFTTVDYVNGPGEIVCQIRDGKNVTLHFLPSEDRIKRGYLEQEQIVQRELSATTSSVPTTSVQP